jgi:hypothetical protein
VRNDATSLGGGIPTKTETHKQLQKQTKTQLQKRRTTHKRRTTMDNLRINLIRQGGYVRNARNQLKEATGILFNSPQRGEFFDGVVQDSKES